MQRLLRLALSLTLVCPAFAYPAEQKAPPPAFDAQQVKQIISSVNSMGQLFKVMEALARPGEFVEVKKYLRAKGITQETAVPKMTLNGTKVQFAGVKGEYDLKNLAAGKIDNGRSVMTINGQRGMVENLKAAADYFHTGNYHASWLFTAAYAEPPSTAGHAASVVATAVGLIAGGLLGLAITGALAVPAAVGGVLAAMSAAFLIAGRMIKSQFTQLSGNVYVDCDKEEGELVVRRRTGMVDESLNVEDYFSTKVEHDVWQATCEKGVLGALNEYLQKFTPAEIVKKFKGKTTETKK